MIPVLIGTLLALVALAFVLYPLFSGNMALIPQSHSSGSDIQISKVDALREIEFDHATGKLSESDYGKLKASYTAQALAEMREAQSDACPACGSPREAEALFCSQCGIRLGA